MKNWKELVKSVAPTIGSALGTAVGGPIWGAAVKKLGEHWLGKSDATEEDVAAAIAGATPEQLLEMKKLDQQFERDMAQLRKDLEVDLERIDAGDRASAREREKALKDWVPSALAVTNALAFFVLLFLMLSRSIPDANKSAFDILLGMLGGNMLTVMTYYFGSSRGSRAKDELLSRRQGN